MNELVKIKRKVDFQRIENWFNIDTCNGVYDINDDLTVDFSGNLWWQCLDLEEIPVRFRKFKGAFFVGRNKLKSTEGFPLNAERIECHENSIQLYRPGGYTGLFFNVLLLQRLQQNTISGHIRIHPNTLAELTPSGQLLSGEEQKEIYGVKQNVTTQFY